MDTLFRHFSVSLTSKILAEICTKTAHGAHLCFPLRNHLTWTISWTKSPEGPSIKYVTLFLHDFWPPLSTNCHKSWTPPKSMSHFWTKSYASKYQENADCTLNGTYDHYYACLNNNKRPYWAFLINPEIPMKVKFLTTPKVIVAA